MPLFYQFSDRFRSILASVWVPKRTRGPSFFDLCFEHPKKVSKRVPGYPQVSPSIPGYLKSEALGSPKQTATRVRSHNRQITDRHIQTEQPLSTRLTRKRGGGYKLGAPQYVGGTPCDWSGREKWICFFLRPPKDHIGGGFWGLWGPAGLRRLICLRH